MRAGGPVTAWAIPRAHWATAQAPGEAARYNQLSPAMNNKPFQCQGSDDSERDFPLRRRTAARIEQGDLFKIYARSESLTSGGRTGRQHSRQVQNAEAVQEHNQSLSDVSLICFLFYRLSWPITDSERIRPAARGSEPRPGENADAGPGAPRAAEPLEAVQHRNKWSLAAASRAQGVRASAQGTRLAPRPVPRPRAFRIMAGASGWLLRLIWHLWRGVL